MIQVAVWTLGALLAVVWLSRVVDAALGMPQVPNLIEAAWDKPVAESNAPQVSIIVPARNEGESIARCLQSLLALEYPDYEIIAVDDRSTDATGRIMDQVAATAPPSSRLKVIHVTELPAGWLGKTHAMWTAASQAAGEWLLFTDGDIFFRPDTLRRVMACVEQKRLDHMVLLPTMEMATPGESMMIGFFQVMFTFGHRPWKVSDPKTRDHLGAGCFNLVRRSAYETVGGYERLRLAVVDDMKLGQMVKEHGYRQNVAFGRDLIRLHWAPGALGVVQNLTKNAFAVMNFNLAKTLGAAFLMLVLNMGPWLGLGLAHGWARLGYGLAVLAIALLYLGMSWYSPISALYFVTNPLGALMFAYILVRSAFLTLARGGVLWRGTLYSLKELRRGMV
ncbi:MAG TPA: glycosyltransferase family 2 protein [Terriglobales bacterium]|nr:glycosyltransferase family 2 protein [Terriglobales bacterium]